MNQMKSSLGRRRGAAAVEFALVAPLFIMLTFGMIEAGRMILVQQLLTNAVREGARNAVLVGATQSDVKSFVANYLSNTSVPVSASDVDVTPDPATAVADDAITVTVTVPYANISWLPTPAFAGGLSSMNAAATMRFEGE
jgi:Flp pilus assembly protein TadG